MHVPADILLEILRYLEGSDLKQVRLVSSSCNTYASKYLFETVYISVHQLDYDVFSAMAEHPSISKHVQFLRYDASQFPITLSKSRYLRYLSVQLWRLLVHDQEFPCQSPDPLADEIAEFIERSDSRDWSTVQDQIWQKYRDCSFVEEGYQTFMKYAKHQLDAPSDLDYWKRVSKTLKQFPNLQGAEIYDEWCCSACTDWPGRKNTLKVSTHGDVLRKASPLTRSWNVLFLRPLDWSYGSSFNRAPITSNGSYEFGIMNFILHNASKQIRQLKTSNEEIHTSLSPSIWDSNDLTGANLMAGCFWPYARLEVLSLSIDESDWSLPFYFRPLTGLQTLLYYVPGLKKLRLRLPSDNGAENGTPYSIEKVFPSQAAVWPRLEVFEIANLRVDPVRLMALLKFDMPALRVLYFLRIGLEDRTWEEVIECMNLIMSLSAFHVSQGCGLLYPDRKTIRNAERHVIDTSDIIGFTQEHKSFLTNIERYVVQGGRHPFSNGQAFDESLFERAQKLASSALNLTMEKRSSLAKA